MIYIDMNVTQNNKDPRLHEMAHSNLGVKDYDIKVEDWHAEHEYFLSGKWGRRFNGLFLDYGCGTGLVSRFLVDLKRKVIGIDISKNMCRLAKKKYGISIVIGDCTYLPFINRAFSIICVSGVLHHMPRKLEIAFTELRRCSRKAICIIEPSTTKALLPIRFIRFFIKIANWTTKQFLNKNKKNTYIINPSHRALNPKDILDLCSKDEFDVTELRFFNHIPKLHKLLKNTPSLEKHLINALISSHHGTHMEIIAERMK